MKLSKRNWLVRLYLFNYNFTLRDCDYPYTDLCHLMRVILIWLPFKFVAGAVLLSALVVWFDIWALPIAIILIGGGVFLGALLGLAIGGGKGWKVISSSETFQIFSEAVKAKKQKICPFIEIVD